MAAGDRRFGATGIFGERTNHVVRTGDLFLYVAVYTPLKLRHWSNTLIGTLPGALPVWMGWTATGGSLEDVRAWTLLGILVAWQLPHFMSIAWLYREQYEAARI